MRVAENMLNGYAICAKKEKEKKRREEKVDAFDRMHWLHFHQRQMQILVSSRPLQEGVEEMKKENGREEMESKAPGFESMSSAFAEKTLEETT